MAVTARRAEASAWALSSGASAASRAPRTARTGHCSGSVPRLSASSPARRRTAAASSVRPASSCATPRNSRPLATCRGAPGLLGEVDRVVRGGHGRLRPLLEQGDLGPHPAQPDPLAPPVACPAVGQRGRLGQPGLGGAGVAQPDRVGGQPEQRVEARLPRALRALQGPLVVALGHAVPAQLAVHAGDRGAGRAPRGPGSRRRPWPATRGSRTSSAPPYRPAEARQTPSSQPGRRGLGDQPLAGGDVDGAPQRLDPGRRAGRGTLPARRPRAAPRGRPPRQPPRSRTAARRGARLPCGRPRRRRARPRRRPRTRGPRTPSRRAGPAPRPSRGRRAAATGGGRTAASAPRPAARPGPAAPWDQRNTAEGAGARHRVDQRPGRQPGAEQAGWRPGAPPGRRPARPAAAGGPRARARRAAPGGRCGPGRPAAGDPAQRRLGALAEQVLDLDARPGAAPAVARPRPARGAARRSRCRPRRTAPGWSAAAPCRRRCPGSSRPGPARARPGPPSRVGHHPPAARPGPAAARARPRGGSGRQRLVGARQLGPARSRSPPAAASAAPTPCSISRRIRVSRARSAAV